MFQVNGLFKSKQFLNALFVKVNEIKLRHGWSTEENKIIEDTLNRFNKIAEVKMYGNKFVNNNKTFHHNQSFDNNSNKRYPNTNSNDDNWRKQSNSIKNDSNIKTMTSSCGQLSTEKSYIKPNSQNHDSNKNNYRPSFSKNIEQNEPNDKNGALNKKYHVDQNKRTGKNIDGEFNNHKSNQLHESINNFNDIEEKLKKFQTKYSSLDNVMFELMKNNSKFSRPSSCGMRDTTKGNIESNWQNHSKEYHNEDGRSVQNNFCHQSSTQKVTGIGNSNWRKKLDDEYQSESHHSFQNSHNNSNRSQGDKNPNWQNHQNSSDSKRDTKLESLEPSGHHRQNRYNDNTEERYGSKSNPILKFA